MIANSLKMLIISHESGLQECTVAQRMHHVLTFLVQFYVQSLDEYVRQHSDVIRIPASIAVPLIAVSRHLSIAPILTYADTVLWNWEVIDPAKALSTTNVRMLDLFTGSPQEAHFFLTSLRMEIQGRVSVNAMLRGLPLVLSKDNSDGSDAVPDAVSTFNTITQNLAELTGTFCAVRDELTADFFYNSFRPWIQGADQGVNSPPWLYEGTGLVFQPSGPSAGQSAMMQCFDVFLGIKHPHKSYAPGSGCAYVNAALDPHRDVREGATTLGSCPFAPKKGLKKESPDSCRVSAHCFNHIGQCTNDPRQCAAMSVASNFQKGRPSTSEVDTSFNARMRTYMPGQYQEFLLWLQKHATSLRSRMLQENNFAVLEAHNSAVSAMEQWRNAHIQIVTQYVVIPARQKQMAEVRGTGGTSLIPLLKTYRSNTADAASPLTPITKDQIKCWWIPLEVVVLREVWFGFIATLLDLWRVWLTTFLIILGSSRQVMEITK